jgi:hypothetical protein
LLKFLDWNKPKMVDVLHISGYRASSKNGVGSMAYVKMMGIGFDEFSKAIHYDPETGVMTWKIAPNRRYKAGTVIRGERAVRVNKKTGGAYRYKYVSYLNHQTPASRVAWLLSYGEWPNTTVQFKDGNPENLRLDNLKLAAFPTNIEKNGDRRIYKMSKEAQRHYGVKRYYGITGEQYGDMMAAQKGLCSICSKPETAMLNGHPKVMHVDHCHATNMIRDLLCGSCNGMLGLAKDRPETLRAAADYIERHAKREDNVVFINGSRKES